MVSKELEELAAQSMKDIGNKQPREAVHQAHGEARGSEGEAQQHTGVRGGDDELPGYIARLLVLKRTAVVRSFSATLRAKPQPPSCTRGWKC